MTKIKDVINQYRPKLKKAGRASAFSLYSKLHEEMEEQMRRITNAENEIAAYYKEAIRTGDWEDEMEWGLAAIVHPSEMYFEYFYKILETNDSAYPHWSILDTLVFMSKELWPAAAKVIEKAIDSNNPSWSEDNLNKAFEALTWLVEDEDIEFIQQKCKSENKRVAEMAEYWVHNIYDDWEDEEEDEE